MVATKTREFETRTASTTVRRAYEQLDLNWTEIGGSVGATRKTVVRWRDREHAPSREHRRQLGKLQELLYLVDVLFDGPEEAREWLYSPVPMLRGRTPVSLLVEGEIDQVVSVLAGLESGAFA